MNTKIHFNNVEDAIDTVMKDTSCRGITDVSELVNKAAESNEAITKPINTSKVVDVSGLFKDNTSDKLGKLNLFQKRREKDKNIITRQTLSVEHIACIKGFCFTWVD